MRVVEDLNEANWAGTRDAVHALADGVVEGDFAPAAAAEGAEATPTEVEKIFVERFGPKKDLSILFLYNPAKPAAQVDAFWRTIRNIPNVELLATDEVVAYDVLNYRWTILEASAVDALAADEGEGEFDFDFDPAFEAQFAQQLEAAEAQAHEPVVNKVDLNAAPQA
jgi:hypothetical protein